MLILLPSAFDRLPGTHDNLLCQGCTALQVSLLRLHLFVGMGNGQSIGEVPPGKHMNKGSVLSTFALQLLTEQ